MQGRDPCGSNPSSTLTPDLQQWSPRGASQNNTSEHEPFTRTVHMQRKLKQRKHKIDKNEQNNGDSDKNLVVGFTKTVSRRKQIWGTGRRGGGGGGGRGRRMGDGSEGS